MTAVLARPHYDYSDIDRGSVINGGHWSACQAAIRDRLDLPTRRCLGCWTPWEPQDHYCQTCGAALDSDDPLNRILAAPYPREMGRIRHEPRKEIAARVRKLLSLYRIKGISVTAPSYSMAQSIDIQLPQDPHEYEPIVRCRGESYDRHEYRDCPRCQRRNLARLKLEALILSAYPDLDNRSDSMTDYHDYRLSIS